jgi:Neocarzinostatin family
MAHIVRRSAVVWALLVSAALVSSPAAAQVAPSVVVSPSTDLVDGQVVSVEASVFPANTTLAVIECLAGGTTISDCGIGTAELLSSDASGQLSTDYATSRVIFTNSVGRVDCATDECVLVVGTTGAEVVASSPISFQNTPLPPSPVEIQLVDSGHQEATDFGGFTTVRARMSCATTADVTVRFSLEQTGTSSGSTITVPCTPGSEVLLFSDLISGVGAGAAEAGVFASIDQTVVDAVVGPITIQPHAVVLAALQDRIASDPDALAELFADIEWRLTYNPVFRTRFVRALLLGA